MTEYRIVSAREDRAYSEFTKDSTIAGISDDYEAESDLMRWSHRHPGDWLLFKQAEPGLWLLVATCDAGKFVSYRPADPRMVRQAS